MRIDYDGGQQPVYIGYAPIGTLTSESKWTIKKYIYIDNMMTEMLFAESSNTFDKCWDDRDTYVYV